MGLAIERAAARTYAPRLMSADEAAYYLSISKTTLRGLAIPTTSIGRRVLYDRIALDRFADRAAEQPVPDAEIPAASMDEERRFFESRKRRGAH